MKRIIHAPGLFLIALCGLVCCLCAWETAEEYFARQHDELEARCR
jgi:hypothetical protein